MNIKLKSDLNYQNNNILLNKAISTLQIVESFI
jgi:hypothetical protein